MAAHQQRSMLLLEKVFGTEGASVAPDTKDNYMCLSELTSPERVRDFFELLRQQIKAGEHMERQTNAERLRLAGNDFYKRKEYESALKCYSDAQKDAPFEWRLFSNKALAFIALGRYEEAVMSAQWASIANQASGKGISLQASAYAHLGYVDVAEVLAATMYSRFSRDEQNAARLEIEKVSSQLRPEDRRSLTAMDMHKVCERLFLDEELPLKKYAFFVTHLFQAVISFGHDAVMRLEYNNFFSKIFSIKPLWRVFQPENGAFDLLGETEWFILYEFLMLLHVCRRNQARNSDEVEAFMRRLLSNSVFIKFIQNFALYLAKRETTLHFIKNRTFAQCGCTNFYIQLLSFAGSFSSLRKHYMNVVPFCDPTWYPKVLLLTLCTYDPSTGLTDSLLSLLNNFSKEDFFFAHLTNLPSEYTDKAFGLLAVESIIYARFRPSVKQTSEESHYHFHHHHHHQPNSTAASAKDVLPPPASFIPFWLSATKDPRALSFCVRRLGLWLDVTSRFTLFGCCVLVDLAKRSFENNGELCDSIHLLSNLVSGSEKIDELLARNPNWEEYPMVMQQIIPSMRVLLSCIKKRMRRKTALPDETAELVLSLIALLASRSQKFSTEMSSSYSAADPGSLSRLAAISTADGVTKMPTVLRHGALHCFALLIGDATYESRTKLSKSKHLSGFIRYAIKSVLEFEPTADKCSPVVKNACISLYHLLNPANSADIYRDECIGIVLREVQQLDDRSLESFIKRICRFAKQVENDPSKKKKNLLEIAVPFAKLLKTLCKVDEKITSIVSGEFGR